MAINFFYKSIFTLLLLFAFAAAPAQDKKATTKALVEGKQFLFKVQTVLPTSMPSRNVSIDNYELKIIKDSLVSVLPYFGRAYVAPIGDQRGGYNFTSTDFEYQSKSTKKGGWEIVIRPKDVKEVREFFLTVSENGYANLRASSNNRQLISYSGFISALKK